MTPVLENWENDAGLVGVLLTTMLTCELRQPICSIPAAAQFRNRFAATFAPTLIEFDSFD